MEKYQTVCLDCGKIYDYAENQLVCDQCGGMLDVQMDHDMLKEFFPSIESFLKRSTKKTNSMWKFFPFLPLIEEKHIISLGEGNTPLIESNTLKNALRCADLYFKVETGNPTGSFKDRQVSMGMSKAIEMGYKGVLTVSSGNVGAAVSAYSARAGVPSIVLVHDMSPSNKVLQIQSYGANVMRVASNSTTDIMNAVREYCDKHHYANLMTASPVNPYINQGAKTMAYEIAATFLDKRETMPDCIISPVGGGGLLASVYQGFTELSSIGVIETVPRMIAAQPAGCAPFSNAILEGKTAKEVFSNPWAGIDTIATALADDIPLDAQKAIPAVKNSGGTAFKINDSDILESEKQLARSEGLFVEPSSAITLAALEQALLNGVIDRSEKVVLLLTGSGFKDMDACNQINSEVRRVPLDHDWDMEFK